MCLLFVFIFSHARREKSVRRRRLGRGSFRSAGLESGQIFFYKSDYTGMNGEHCIS